MAAKKKRAGHAKTSGKSKPAPAKPRAQRSREDISAVRKQKRSEPPVVDIGTSASGSETAAGLDDVDQILALLRAETHFDFRGFRKEALVRRLQRRMHQCPFAKIADYLEFLRQHPDELKLLGHELLVRDTGFFHNPEAWRSLETSVIAPLLHAKERKTPVRAWSIGCATGEDAYSLGILLLEQLELARKNCPVRIFATDLDEDSLQAARQGVYKEGDLAAVSPERLARFFTPQSSASYQAGKQLREAVFFARHNFLTDSPFSRLDLIICRDLLVHLEPDVQKRILQVLHYALAEGGCLFLGTSDTIDPSLELFESIDTTWGIYRRRGPARAITMRFPVMKAERRPIEEDLSTWTARLESTIEELQQTNQETTTLNEELQTANEELQTSEEELRVLNSELVAVNSQLQEKNQALETANNDMANLFNSTDIATIFLDSNLRIRRFTPASTRLLSLIAIDVGRPLGDIAKKFTDDDLLPEAQQVLHDQNTREKEVRTGDGRWYARRILPYRTLDNRVDGVVVTFVDITERKQAADAVLGRLAAIVESSIDGIFSKDLGGTIRTWNRGAERVFGYRAEEAVGRSVQMLIPQDRAEEWRHIMRQLTSGEHIEGLETDRLHKDGRRIPVELTYSPLRDENGKVVGVSGIARDISERKRAEAALRESEQRFRLMADNAPVMVWISATDKFCTWFNKPWLDFVGRTMHQELGNGWTENVHAEDFDRCLRTYTQAFDARRTFTMEYRLKRHDGEYRWILDNGIPMYLPDGVFNGYIGSCVDITERKQTEETLRAHEELLQAILDNSVDAIITIDYQGIIQSVNSAAARMFGYTIAELVGQNVKMLMTSPDCEAHDSYLARYLQTGEKHILGISRETQARRKDGSVFPTELAVSEIKHLRLFTGIHRDLTERKQLERDLVEAASLEQRRIGQDLHDSVAQELTALNLLVTDLAETLPTKPAKTAQLVERLQQGLQPSQQELRAVLRGLLPVAVDAEGLMAALTDLANRTQREGKASCIFDCSASVTVADNLTATQLYLIAQEAVHNALKHTQARNLRITLAIATGSLVLSVQDDGTGLPAEPERSSGMGLRVMRSRAAIIGARLTIEPARPTGTVVTCILARTNHEREKEKASADRHRR